MISAYGITEQNKQPTPPPRKPNEDCFGLEISENQNYLTAVVCDGIPVLRSNSGAYPKILNGASASRHAVREILACTKEKDASLGEETLYRALLRANEKIQTLNQHNHCYKKSPPCWIATMALALHINIKGRRAFVGHVGDSLAFYLPNRGTPQILTRDQLAPWILHANRPGHLPHPSGDVFGYKGGVRVWQDTYVRNKSDAKCWCGAKVTGWGALTGEENTRVFVETQTLRLARAGRFVLASDAVCVFSKTKHQRTVTPYKAVISTVVNLSPKDAVHALLSLTREKERETGARSDDATFIVIDFEC